MTVPRWLLALGIPLALWGLLALGWLGVRGTLEHPFASQRPSARSTDRAGAVDSSAPAAGGGDPGTAAEAAATADDPGSAMRRVRVCPREESAPRLSPLSLSSGTGRLSNTAIWAVHCGSVIELVAFDGSGGVASPRRIATLQAAPSELGLSPQPGTLAGGDIDGDGFTDLALAQPLVDTGGAPRGGAVFVLHGAPFGGLTPPQRIAGAAATALAIGTLDTRGGDDFAVLSGGDPRLSTAPELWRFSGGPSPLRVSRDDTLRGADRLLASDLDGDGRDDLVVVSKHEQAYEVWPAASEDAERPEPPRRVELPGLREAISGDLDGDGDEDLLLLGDSLHVRFAGAGESDDPEQLLAAKSLRALSLDDVNVDGKLDIVAYDHPTLRWFEQRTRQRYTEHELTTIRGAGLTVYDVRLAQLDGHGPLDLLVLAVSEGVDPAVELVFDLIAEQAPPEARVSRYERGARPEPLRDAPLSQRFQLR